MEKKRILLVDDVELFLRLEESFLNRGLYSTITARSGEEAIKAASAYRPDLILLDQIMPGINGDDVCRKLKEDPKTEHIPVIIISSDGKDAVRQKCLEAGCDAFLTKPIRGDVLIPSVEKQLGIVNRRAKRIKTSIRCEINWNGQREEGEIHNLSGTGAFVSVQVTPTMGDIVDVSFKLPETEYQFVLGAIIKWVRSSAEEKPSGAGIEFLSFSPGAEEFIQSYIDLLT